MGWLRHGRDGDGDRAPSPVVAKTPAASPAGWAFLPPLQRVIGDQPTTTSPRTFPRELPAWRNPSFTGPMSHLVSGGAPVGIVDGDGRGIGTPIVTAAEIEPPLPLPASRVSMAETAASTSLTKASPDGLPRLQLVAAASEPTSLAGVSGAIGATGSEPQSPGAADDGSFGEISSGYDNGGATVVAVPHPTIQRTLATPIAPGGVRPISPLAHRGAGALPRLGLGAPLSSAAAPATDVKVSARLTAGPDAPVEMQGADRPTTSVSRLTDAVQAPPADPLPLTVQRAANESAAHPTTADTAVPPRPDEPGPGRSGPDRRDTTAGLEAPTDPDHHAPLLADRAMATRVGPESAPPSPTATIQTAAPGRLPLAAGSGPPPSQDASPGQAVRVAAVPSPQGEEVAEPTADPEGGSPTAPPVAQRQVELLAHRGIAATVSAEMSATAPISRPSRSQPARSVALLPPDAPTTTGPSVTTLTATVQRSALSDPALIPSNPPASDGLRTPDRGGGNLVLGSLQRVTPGIVPRPAPGDAPRLAPGGVQTPVPGGVQTPVPGGTPDTSTWPALPLGAHRLVRAAAVQRASVEPDSDYAGPAPSGLAASESPVDSEATPEPAGVSSAGSGASARAGILESPPSQEQLDELARRLMPPLTRRLRAEMLIDRERRGLRSDPR